MNYFFRRNKYFFIGCLAGFILSSIFMPAFEDCNSQRSQPSSSFSSQSATLDFRLAAQLQAWFTEVQQPEYEPVQVNTSLDFSGEEKNGLQNVEPVFDKDEPLVHDKKLKFNRPRFHYTELKLKNELLLGILINSEQLSSSSSNASLKQQILEYINITTEQLFKHYQNIDVYYFYEVERENFNGRQFQTNIVMASAHRGRSAQAVYWGGHTTKHLAILQHLIDRGTASEYSFFFLMNQNTLLSVENLLEHLSQRLTTADEVLSTINRGEVRSRFARDDSVLNYGLLISASLLSLCQLDVPCLLSRSTVHSSHAACHLSSPSKLVNTISGAITVYPVAFNSQMDHKLRSAIEAERISRLKGMLTFLENQIVTENNRTLWPPGVFGYQRPHTRYEVTKWSYWNASHAFMPNDIQVIRRLNEAELGELRELRKICSRWTKDGSSEHSSGSITSVYRKFDAVRGLEYLVDFSSDDSRFLRLQVVKPLNPLELITDVPYVTENMHLTLVLPVRGFAEVPLAIRFLNHYSNVCLKKSSNHATTTLIIVLIYTRHLTLSESIESAVEYERQEFGRLKKVSLYIQAKFAREEEGGNEVKIVFLDFHPPDPLSGPSEGQTEEGVPPLSSFPSELAYLDLIARSLTLTSSDTAPQPFLLLHCRSNMLLTPDFLNRVRLNTIAGRQVFLPIPFVEYRVRTSLSNSVFQQAIHQQQQSGKTDFLNSLAELVKRGRGEGGNDEGIPSSDAFDIRKENGYFDHLNHELVAFYLSDYLAARRRQEWMPMIRNHQSVVRYQHLLYNATTDLRHLFLLTVPPIAQMRAVEPELRLQHSDIIADLSCEYFESNVHSLESCHHRRAVGLGPKQKLASIVLEYLQVKRRRRRLDGDDSNSP